MRGGLLTPMELPGYPEPDKNGDRRDVHDHNPSQHLNVAHDRGPDTLSIDFVEGMPEGRGAHGYIPQDVLSTPMLGQRRTTGEYESMRTEMPRRELAEANREQHHRTEAEHNRFDHEKELFEEHL